MFKSTIVLSVILFTCLQTSFSWAEGLIDRLPPDGTLITFDYHEKVKVQIKGIDEESLSTDELTELRQSKSFEMEGPLTIASVGNESVAGQPCRWIEIRHVQVRKGPNPRSHEQIYKLLIPEKFLTAGVDPLKHALKIYYASSPRLTEPRLLTNKDHQRIELARLRKLFPKGSAERRVDKRQKGQKIDTPLGEMICERRIYDSYLDEYLGGPTRQQWYCVHSVWLSDKCPFGVAAFQCTSDAQEVGIPLDNTLGKAHFQLRTLSISSVLRLTVKSIEKNAKSLLPKHN